MYINVQMKERQFLADSRGCHNHFLINLTFLTNNSQLTITLHRLLKGIKQLSFDPHVKTNGVNI